MNFPEVLVLSAAMGLSIYLSLPIVLSRGTGHRQMTIMTAVAIGILLFLMGDIFADAAGSMYDGSLFGYGSSVPRDLIFIASLVAGFLFLFISEGRSKQGLTTTGIALVIAVGMGFQNLTEGLVFGSLGASVGLAGAALVVLVGFILQNITEGFPIASPFLGEREGKSVLVMTLFMIGGLPAVFGGAIGYYYNSTSLDLAFDGIAVGAILYAILPMLRGLFRNPAPGSQRLSYLGVFLGFLIGMLVNLI
jgi:ZIP family zinc transporter